jgi:hypothetical protein
MSSAQLTAFAERTPEVDQEIPPSVVMIAFESGYPWVTATHSLTVGQEIELSSDTFGILSDCHVEPPS